MHNELNILTEIGTPKAALALVPFLWHKDNDLASRTALNLATLLPKPEIENALRGYELTKEQQKAGWFKWVWEPFKKYESDNSSLPIISGRIGYLIDQLPEKYVINFNKVSNIDSRILIPLVINNQTKWKEILNLIIKKYPKKELVKLNSILNDKDIPTPILNDWRNIFTPLEVQQKEFYEDSKEARSIVILLSIMIFWTYYKNYQYFPIVYTTMLIVFIPFIPFGYIKSKRRLKNPLRHLLKPPKR
ncbi:hypothetical protein QUF74_13140 [Candidatus Halobeggiatoa sp. HSG11]|nr:hypothetical protein [Candidatus Halobeggiatoa sp. HSG11]